VPEHGRPARVTGVYVGELPVIREVSLPTVGPGQTREFHLFDGFDLALHEVSPEDGVRAADDEDEHTGFAAAVLDGLVEPPGPPDKYEALARAAREARERQSQVDEVIRLLGKGEAA
jgi:hypothetical protein